jgi:hypothetical protein
MRRRSPPRVPPSAWRTSQSSQTVRSVIREKSTTPRSARPMSRWISTDRPSSRPVRSRCLRSLVAPGSIEYSAVSQPRPFPMSQLGTPSVTLAVHSTIVRPKVVSTDPGTALVYARWKLIGRGSLAALP